MIRVMSSRRAYPATLTIDGDLYHYEKILKEDFFSINVLYRAASNTRYVLKVSAFRFVFGFLLTPLAILMSRREYKLYSMVADIPLIPALGPRLGTRGYLHRFVEGKTLYELEREGRRDLPDDFFDRLRATVEEIHRRRIFYIDLNKQGNIILGEDGLPYLIDFQVCIHFKYRNRLFDRLFALLIQEDIYHLYKHKKRFRPDLMTETEKELAQRSKLGEGVNRYFGDPYRKIKRKIYPSGSNEVIWYKWKKMKDKSKRTS
jgi:hypothetical protein